MTNSEKIAKKIINQLHDMIDDSECENYVELNEDNLEDFVEGLLLAMCVFKNDIASPEEDLLAFTHTLNKIAFRYLNENE